MIAFLEFKYPNVYISLKAKQLLTHFTQGNFLSKQLSFIKPQTKFFGGALPLGKRKTLRPLSSKDCIHFVLRSQWAYGKDSFLTKQNYKSIDRILKHFAFKFEVRIYQKSINSNHIHLLLRITNRKLYHAFIKAITGKIAQQVINHRCKAHGFNPSEQSFKLFLQLKKKSLQLQNQPEYKINSKVGDGAEGAANAGDGAEAATKNERFWQFRPFSRLVNWGKDFKFSVQYLKQNILEALGFIKYTPRKLYYAKWIRESYPLVT